MKKEHVEKCEKDRKTIINTIDVRIPETFEELISWKLSEDATDMEKYIYNRKYEDWKKGCLVTIASKIDSRTKGLDEGTKKIVTGYKNASQNIKDITDKILRGEMLTKEEMMLLSKKEIEKNIGQRKN